MDQARRLEQFERETQRLRRAVSDPTLDKVILTEAARELTEPRAPAAVDRACAQDARRVRAARLPRAAPAPIHPEEGVAGPGRGGSADGGHRRAGQPTRPLRPSAYHSTSPRRRLVGEPQAPLSGSCCAGPCRAVVERIWRAEGRKVPARQPKRGRRWLTDGSCMRRRAERPNHVWSDDVVQNRAHDGRLIRMLTVIDEYTRECLGLPVARRLKSDDVLAVLADLFVGRGPPEHIRSDDGPEFTATAVRDWLGRVGMQAAFIEPGSPWENRYNESFNGKLRNELLDREVFYTLAGACVLISAWRRHHNTVRLHSALGYQPSAPEAISPPAADEPWMPSGFAPLRLLASMAQERPICPNILSGPPDGGRSWLGRRSARSAPHRYEPHLSVSIPYPVSLIAINAIKGAASNRDRSIQYPPAKCFLPASRNSLD